MHSVLVYHTISAPPQALPADIDVAPERFAAHLAWLARHRRAATLDAILATPERARLAAITFDDGFRDNLTTALPLLERFNLPGAVFVTTEFIGQPDYLSAAELRELAAHPLITIGSHGVTHQHFTEIDRKSVV